MQSAIAPSPICRRTKRDKAGEHKAILDAALSRKVEKAQILVDRHIRSTTQNVLDYAGKLLEDGQYSRRVTGGT